MCKLGNLKVHCFLEGTFVPVDNVSISIYNCDDTFNISDKLGTYKTNKNGFTEIIKLDAPPIENSKEPLKKAYTTYCAIISKEGFKPLEIRGIQIFPNVISIQKCYLEKGENKDCSKQTIVIPKHKHATNACSLKSSSLMPNNSHIITSSDLKKAPLKESKKKSKSRKKDFRVLSRVEVPQYVIVHCGSPTNVYAPNYTVPFIDYIKNVASSELYSTWESDCLRANIYCIVSFVLNRIYTEWYPSKGYNFDITNDTAYDQYFVYGRTTYDSIDSIVDGLFDIYIRADNQVAPFFAQFCNGTTVTCPGWLSQWGSEYLSSEGYAPYEILTYYYGNNINLDTAPYISGDPRSYPNNPLSIGSRGTPVKTIQSQLNRISANYPLIPTLSVDGIYGPLTANSVKVYQGIFNLPQTGITNKATWYSISNVYVGVSNLNEINQN